MARQENGKAIIRGGLVAQPDSPRAEPADILVVDGILMQIGPPGFAAPPDANELDAIPRGRVIRRQPAAQYPRLPAHRGLGTDDDDARALRQLQQRFLRELEEVGLRVKDVGRFQQQSDGLIRIRQNQLRQQPDERILELPKHLGTQESAPRVVPPDRLEQRNDDRKCG